MKYEKRITSDACYISCTFASVGCGEAESSDTQTTAETTEVQSGSDEQSAENTAETTETADEGDSFTLNSDDFEGIQEAQAEIQENLLNDVRFMGRTLEQKQPNALKFLYDMQDRKMIEKGSVSFADDTHNRIKFKYIGGAPGQ